MVMDALQIGLVLTGAGALLAVWGYNRWVARKHAPRQAAAPLPGASELALPPDDAAAPALPDDDFSRLPQIDRKPVLDALLDTLAAVEVDHPVAGEAALAALPSTRRIGTKPFHIEGCSETTGLWEPVMPRMRYSAFQAGLQLANRMGPLNDIEYSEFVVKMQAFADALGGTLAMGEMRHEVARAREMDQFAQAHDAQLSVVLVAKDAAWSPGFIQQHAAQLGFVAAAMPGRMVLPASAAGPHAALSLTFDSQAALAADPTQTPVHECALTLDVPQVLRAEQAFERLQHAALVLAHGMGATITDGAGQVLSPEAMALIAQDLEHLYDAFEQRELPAGSALARRLFA